MAHFAEIDESGIVKRVLAVNDADTADGDANEVESIGVAYLAKKLGGSWVQTSYNNKRRIRFAGRGMKWRADLDAFILGQPFESWVLDESEFEWVAPTPKPDDNDKRYQWNEAQGEWVEVEWEEIMLDV